MIILDIIVLVFSDIIFLTLFGWAVNPVYDLIEKTYNTALANSFLLVIELIFYGLVLAGIILLIEKIVRDRKRAKGAKVGKKSRKMTVKEKMQKEQAKEAAKNKKSKESVKNNKSSEPEKKKKREYREYV